MRSSTVLLVTVVLAGPAPAAGPKPSEGKPVKELILPGESFLIAGRPAFVLLPPPQKRTRPQPWVLYAPTLPGLPDNHEKWMHEQFLAAGVAVAGIDVGEAYGGPKGRELFTALYRELTTRRGFAPRPCLLGRSRGGLWVTSWAADNPDKVAGLAGIYPAFDLRSYPGLATAAPAYGLTPREMRARLDTLNPISRVGVLAKARIPVLLIHGDEDRVVPLNENSAAFVARYKAGGAKESVKLIVARGQGHNYWEGFFRCRELVDFVVARAKARSEPSPTQKHPLQFIDTSFENASPLWYEVGDDGVVLVHLLYDHERSSPNRAAGHFHFQLQARAGTRLTVEFKNLENVWNGRKASVAPELKAAVVSEDGRHWRSVPLRQLPGGRVRLAVEMPGPRLYVARVEPYRLSDLNRLLTDARKHPRVRITPIGKTAEGRPLEVLQIGSPQAPYRAFVRARAHPWEAGGSWVVDGLVRRLLKGDATAEAYLRRYCLYVLPMANKDGVARGRTRFNARGKDLNRDWDRPADPELAPENAALEGWLKGQIRAGRPPQLALDLHNDGRGLLHVSRGPGKHRDRHVRRMETLEALLRKHTWFTEGHTGEGFHNAGTLGEGWLARYDIDAVVHEFNCNWIAGLREAPLGHHWKAYGERLATVFDEYFGSVKP